MIVTLIKIALIYVGGLATLAAFGGDTWEKDKEGKFVRVNGRGWLAITCLVLALLGGTCLEILDHTGQVREAALAEADKRQLQEKVDSLNAKATLLSEMLKRVPQEIEHPYFSKDRNENGFVLEEYMSTKPKENKLVVYPGEILDYDIYYPPSSKATLIVELAIGGRPYKTENRGSILVIGGADDPLNVRVNNYSEQEDGFRIKFVVRSSVRHLYEGAATPRALPGQPKP
jgi:hypothetical protein